MEVSAGLSCLVDRLTTLWGFFLAVGEIWFSFLLSVLRARELRTAMLVAISGYFFIFQAKHNDLTKKHDDEISSVFLVGMGRYVLLSYKNKLTFCCKVLMNALHCLATPYTFHSICD